MAYDDEKSKHEKLVVVNPTIHTPKGGLLGDDETGGPRFVTSCTTHYTSFDGTRSYSIASQMCHSFVNHLPSLVHNKKDIVVVDRIQGATRTKIIGKDINDDEATFFLQYFMDHKLFRDSFFEHDAKTALQERMMIRNVSSLPSNQNMFAIIATRALWEGYQRKIPRRMCNLIEDGIKPDMAFLLAHYVKKEDGEYIKSVVMSSGHTALQTDHFSIKCAKNYIKHNPIGASPGPNIIFGYNYARYNVRSLFNDRTINIDDFFEELVLEKNHDDDENFQDFLDGYGYSLSQLKEVEEYLYA